MKFRYDKEDDILMIWFSNQKVDHAKQEKNVIIHFSKEEKPVLMEIMEASLFLKETSKVLPPNLRNCILA